MNVITLSNRRTHTRASGVRMRQIVANDRVSLRVDVPELDLVAGDVGRVVSTWFYPNAAFEVEFAAEPGGCARRVLLLEHQVALVPDACEPKVPGSSEVYRARSFH